ncbi:hypothetical protein [Spelaeicoccus albus]|uniref:Uncharacterized membrane protein HdeD (DUF308 family) n=1 Tax=Spelaeicoccus albus TaxID=1280376 RepID=A0A7Z0D541_9MICO|nr:hypothetical protein [Spelaeicoccus albus]NYI69062.1 uncharacterized membrane protein HdeD (DUF308 family) [Spelaeicoccus albus]
MGNKPQSTPSGNSKGSSANAASSPTRAQQITGIVLGIFLCVAGVTIAVVSLTGVMPAGKSNSPITWVVSIVLVLLGVMWLIVGLRGQRKR